MGRMAVRDGSSFTLVKMNKGTRQELIEGQRRVIGAAKAEAEQRRMIAELPMSESTAGWTWDLRGNSMTARSRLAFGFRPGPN